MHHTHPAARLPLVLWLAAACGVAAGFRQEPRFHGATHVVSVYATVVDGNGRLVPGLTRDDFEVFDNGRPQPLTVFASDVRPITIVIMLDRSGSMAGRSELVSDAAEQFVRQLLPADQARVGRFSDDIRIDPDTFTSDRDELVRLLHEPPPHAGDTPLWNATARAMDALQGRDGRRVVLVFTDGKDNPDPMKVNATFDQVRDRSQAEEIMVYAIGLVRGCDSPPLPAPAPAGPAFSISPAPQGRQGRIPRIPIPRFPRPPVPPPRTPPAWPEPPGRGTPEPPPLGTPWESRNVPCVEEQPDEELQTLAEVGGGGYFVLKSANDLPSTFARVADELHQQYLLAFRAPELDGQSHQIEVRVRRDGLTARARKSYLARR